MQIETFGDTATANKDYVDIEGNDRFIYFPSPKSTSDLRKVLTIEILDDDEFELDEVPAIFCVSSSNPRCDAVCRTPS